MKAVFFITFLSSLTISLSARADFTIDRMPKDGNEIHHCFEVENLDPNMTGMKMDLDAAEKRNQLDGSGPMYDMNEAASLTSTLDTLISARRNVDRINKSDATQDAGYNAQKAFRQSLDLLVPKAAIKELREKIPQYTDELAHMIWLTRTKNPNCPALLKQTRERDAQPAPPVAKSVQ